MTKWAVAEPCFDYVTCLDISGCKIDSLMCVIARLHLSILVKLLIWSPATLSKWNEQDRSSICSQCFPIASDFVDRTPYVSVELLMTGNDAFDVTIAHNLWYEVNRLLALSLVLLGIKMSWKHGHCNVWFLIAITTYITQLHDFRCMF